MLAVNHKWAKNLPCNENWTAEYNGTAKGHGGKDLSVTLFSSYLIQISNFVTDS